MNSMNERRVLVEQMATKMNKNIFEGVADKLTEPRLQLQKQSEKLTSLEEAIKRCGLKDGMTISFHHHFRGGDKVVNLVVGKLAEMGFKNLHVAASSLQDVHEPLIEHIKNGVVTKISTSGLRGALATEISHGLMDNPVVFRSHGGRGSAVANGDLHIDVAFLGASSCDPLGNACGFSRSENAKSICGSLGYALPDARYADKVVILTDDLVPYPNTPNAIFSHHYIYGVTRSDKRCHLVNDAGNATPEQRTYDDRQCGVGGRVGVSTNGTANDAVAAHQHIDIEVAIHLKG